MCQTFRAGIIPGSRSKGPRQPGGDPMSFDDVMTGVGRWLTATEALAAVGAELTLEQAPEPGDPAVVGALQAVSAAAGLAGLEELTVPQRQMVTGLIRM